MIEMQQFNFKPVQLGDNITIHSGGMKIDVDVSYGSLVNIVQQLNDKDRYELMMLMRSMGN